MENAPVKIILLGFVPSTQMTGFSKTSCFFSHYRKLSFDPFRQKCNKQRRCTATKIPGNRLNQSNRLQHVFVQKSLKSMCTIQSCVQTHAQLLTRRYSIPPHRITGINPRKTNLANPCITRSTERPIPSLCSNW